MKSRPALQPASTPRAFTLIELITVIAIIAILAALLLATAGFVQEKAGNSRAQTEIASLNAALEAYKMDYGDYPKDGANGDANSTSILIKSLAKKDDDNNPNGKIYFEVPRKMLEGKSTDSVSDLLNAGGARLIDPFGNPYHYQYPGKADRSGTQTFDLWSQGKKNNTTEDLWIKNW